MDRNGKPNPFAAFDDMVPKAAAPNNSGNSKPNAFAGFPATSTDPFSSMPVNQSGGLARPGGFSATSPTATGFAPTQQTRPVSTPASFDAFGFPISNMPPAKVNPFDAFSSTPMQPTKSAPAGGAFDFTATTNRPLSTPMPMMSNQSNARSAAFDGFAPTGPSLNSPSRPVLDPFSSIPTPQAGFPAPGPLKPQKPTPPPQMEMKTQKPPAAFNPFENINFASQQPASSFSTTAVSPSIRPEAVFQQPQPAPARVFAQVISPPPANNVSASGSAPARRIFADAQATQPDSIAQKSSPFPVSSPFPASPFDGFQASTQPAAISQQQSVAVPSNRNTSSFPASPFDGFQPSSQPVTSSQQLFVVTADSNPFSESEKMTPAVAALQGSNYENPFSQPFVAVPPSAAANRIIVAPPPADKASSTSPVAKPVVAPSLLVPASSSAVIETLQGAISPGSQTAPALSNQSAKPLATYQGRNKAKGKVVNRVAPQSGSAFNRRRDQTAIWTKPYFADLFTKPYFDDSGDAAKSQSVANIRQSIRTVRDSLFRMVTDKDSFMEERYSSMVARALELFDSGCEIFDKFPSRSGDNEKLYTFIEFFMQRVRGMPVGSVLLIPVGWLTESGMEKTIFNNLTGHVNKPPSGSTLGTECAAVLILHRSRETAHRKDFNVTIVNTNNVPDSGFDYHAVKIDPTDGSLLHNLSFAFHNIENERIFNTSFWLLLFKSGVYSNVKFGSKFIYERVLPYLTTMPVTHTMTRDTENVDYFPLPPGGDKSGINCALECLRQVIRQQGADELQANHVPFLVKWDILKSVEYEMQDLRAILPLEIDMIGMACRAVAKSAAAQVGPKTAESTTTVSAAQLSAISESITAINRQLQDMDDRMVAPPAFSLVADERLSKVCEWPLFGRLRREFDVETLAGDSPVAPIIRPVEMTLIADKVSNFQDVAAAMRHALNLCVLLANQRAVVRNSYTLRVCMLEHLFVRLIPLPLPITHMGRDNECFWHAQPMRYETQADILRLLSKLSIHFATASLSVKSTRSGDAVRMMTFACMATVCDATLRKIACDIPSQSSLHYSGLAKGPVHAFGFELGTFEEESEYLKLSYPESAVARTQVLDYFHQMKKKVSPDHMLFNFEKGNECCSADKLYIDQLCVQMGFRRGDAAFDITSPNKGILQLYPEIAFFRDVIFMFKLVMVPTLDMLPEVKCWEPDEAVLGWAASSGSGSERDNSSYTVTGFGRKLECTHLAISVEEQQLKYKLPRGIFSRFLRYVGVGTKKPRSTPSQANPSILLGERVDTEDDILHIKNLPDFDGTLGARDCELMLQYLTAPYMRIPLLLSFFSNEVRLKALRNKDMQEVLDAAMFEPGQWKCDYDIPLPSQIPAPERDHLCTPVGLLFNEIVMSPNAILTSVLQMLEKVVDMDTGKYSELGESILYVTRLAIRVEGYLLFLIRNKKFHSMQKNADTNIFNGAYVEADVRGLRCGQDVIDEALECQKRIRALLEEKMFKIIARWIKRSKKDGRFGQACMLHAHLAFIYRNVEPEELTPRVVFTVLASQIFLFNYYKYDLDIDLETKENKKSSQKDVDPTVFDLVIPNVELFGMFQRNRRMILTWLQKSPEERNKVLPILVLVPFTALETNS
jgi:hypothetical protein